MIKTTVNYSSLGSMGKFAVSVLHGVNGIMGGGGGQKALSKVFDKLAPAAPSAYAYINKIQITRFAF